MQNNKGLTLIELVLSIIIISICFLVLAMIYQQVLNNIYGTRVMSIASALAEEKTDDVFGKGYSGITNQSSASFSSPFSDYTYEVVVNYVNDADLNTPVDPTVTEYKRVEVRVTHSQTGTFRMVSLLSDYNS